ncbi:MAG: hypothetical protein EP338_06250 [Bacteroidetes bacterium]|nr:MAG: hypothetical protein EP338_06250 [Bacteroidota bacterium]
MINLKNRTAQCRKVFFQCLLCLIIATPLFAQKYQFRGAERAPVTAKIEKRIASLYELIITDIQTAEKEIRELEKLAEQNENNEFTIDVLMLEAEMYYAHADFVHMKLSVYQAISWKDEETGDYFNALIDYYMALNEGSRGNHEQEKKMLEAVMSKARANKYDFLEARLHRSLGRHYVQQEDYSKAQDHFAEAHELFLELGYVAHAFDVNISRGIASFRMEDYDRALNYFHQARNEAQLRNHETCYGNALISIAEAQLFIPGGLDSAWYYAGEFAKRKEHADERDLLHYYWTLEHYYKQKGQMDSAYHYLDKVAQLDSRIIKRMNSSTNKEIDAVFMRLQNERKLEDERNTQKNFKWIFGSIGIFLLILLIILWVVLKEKSRYSFVLMSQKDEILHKNKQIDAALKEKELLLKEIHHRVKNNLQIISSMLSLQSKNIDDEKARQAILEGKERIQAIALIHQRLYHNEAFATIRMKDYLDDLIEQLGVSYNDRHRQIKLVLETNDIVLNIDTVVPLGLIICELTTNAFKYAFDDQLKGRLKIEIRQEEEGYLLYVKDNGIGMDENFNLLESNTLGMEIVRALVDQLEGSISYRTSENGTAISIHFKELKNR